MKKKRKRRPRKRAPIRYIFFPSFINLSIKKIINIMAAVVKFKTAVVYDCIKKLYTAIGIKTAAVSINAKTAMRRFSLSSGGIPG